jgi:AcrR family transcriptional regulator
MSSSFSEKDTKTSGSSASGECCVFKSRPRDRIVSSARVLFHKHGIRGIGVDAIAEAAGTNKMTLYRHFGSKDDLVVECLRKVAVETEQVWAELEAKFPSDPLRRLQGWIEAGAECINADSRGCDLANAAVELAERSHPAKKFVEEFKTAQRNRLAALCQAAGASQPDLLADALWLLLEGARVSRQSVGAEGPCARFVRLSEAIISSFGVPISPALSAEPATAG